MSSNEELIRKATKRWLANKFPSATIRDEFTQSHLCIRNDLFAVSSKHSVSVEIKSDKDNFSRLEKQILGYKLFSNIVIVAIDKKHFNSYVKRFMKSELFNGVGLLVYDGYDVQEKIAAYHFEFPMMYDMMWSSELQLFFTGLKLRSKIGKSAKESKEYISKMFTYQEIYDISKYIFVERIAKNDLISSLPTEWLELILTKQEAFTALIKGIK